MMRTAVFLLSLQFGSSQGGVSDWVGADKAKHFFLGAFTQSFGHGTVRLLGGNGDVAIGVASAGTVTVAVWKELYDLSGKGTASPWDAAWTLGGGAAVSTLLVRAR